MTDKELIKNEIESRIQECKDSKIDSSYYDGLIFAFEEVRDFINSLPEEPVSEELEEAMQHNAPDNIGIDDLLYWRNGFIAGAKWGRNQAMAEIQTQSMALAHGCPKELESEDLEEAVNTYIGYPPEVDECSSVYGKRQAFKAGAKWQKEQMMKSVLASQEMTCIQVAHRLIGGSWNLACPTDKIGLKSNDKVKVIIIKD